MHKTDWAFGGIWMAMVSLMCLASAASETNGYPSELATGEYSKQIADQRVQTIELMTRVLKDATTSAKQKCEAANVLGILRAEEAIPDLLKNLKISTSVRWRDTQGNLSKQYPSFGALKCIGSAASGPLLDRLEKDLSKTERSLAIWLLIDIETLPVAKFKLELRIKGTKDDGAKQRLQMALAELIEFEHDMDGRD